VFHDFHFEDSVNPVSLEEMQSATTQGFLVWMAEKSKSGPLIPVQQNTRSKTNASQSHAINYPNHTSQTNFQTYTSPDSMSDQFNRPNESQIFPNPTNSYFPNQAQSELFPNPGMPMSNSHFPNQDQSFLYHPTSSTSQFSTAPHESFRPQKSNILPDYSPQLFTGPSQRPGKHIDPQPYYPPNHGVGELPGYASPMNPFINNHSNNQNDPTSHFARSRRASQANTQYVPYTTANMPQMTMSSNQVESSENRNGQRPYAQHFMQSNHHRTPQIPDAQQSTALSNCQRSTHHVEISHQSTSQRPATQHQGYSSLPGTSHRPATQTLQVNYQMSSQAAGVSRSDLNTNTHHQSPRTSKLLQYLPTFIQPYVEKILDVNADGHCGFRSTAVCLGQDTESYMDIRQQLYHEIRRCRDFYVNQGTFDNIEWALAEINATSSMPCGANNRMIMPSMGEAMANAFERPVFFYGKKNESQTCFPHFCPPNNNPPIFIGYLEGKWHFVALKMKNPHLFPAPKNSKAWERTATIEAQAWKDRYTACFDILPV
jgi:hypothetical protein